MESNSTSEFVIVAVDGPGIEPTVKIVPKIKDEKIFNEYLALFGAEALAIHADPKNISLKAFMENNIVKDQ